MISALHTYPLGLGTSYKVRDLDHGLELWHIGQDRLPEYVDLFTDRYNAVYREHFERDRPREETINAYKSTLLRSVNIGVCYQGSLVTTAIAFLAHCRDFADQLPEGLENVFDLPMVATQLGAHRLWYANRFAIHNDYRNSAGRVCIHKTIGPVVGEIMSGEHGQIMLGCMEHRVFRIWRKIGLDWTRLDAVPYEIRPEWKMWRAYLRGSEL